MAGRAEMAAAEAAMGRLAAAAWDARAALTAAGIPGPGAGAEARAWARRVLGAGLRALEPLELLLAELEAPAAPGPAAPAAAGTGTPLGDAPAGLGGVAGAGEVAAAGAGAQAGGGLSAGVAGGAQRPWADLPAELLEKVARAVPAEDRLWFRLVCRDWATAGAGVAPAAGEKPLPRGKVTRTRGPDAAASVARAEMVLGVLEGSARERFKRHLCAFSAEGGCLEVLQWARAQGLPMDATTCAGAASGGHLEVLKWARAQGCTWDDRTTTAAAENGHLEVLQWARSKKKASSGQSPEGKCPWKSGGKGFNLAA